MRVSEIVRKRVRHPRIPMTPDNPNISIPPPLPSSPEAAALPPLPKPSDESRAHTALGAGACAPANPAPRFLRSMLGDGAGNVSAMRVVFVLAVLIVTLTWAIISVRAGVLQPLPGGVPAVIAILTGGKLWQNGQENDLSDSE